MDSDAFRKSNCNARRHEVYGVHPWFLTNSANWIVRCSCLDIQFALPPQFATSLASGFGGLGSAGVILSAQKAAAHSAKKNATPAFGRPWPLHALLHPASTRDAAFAVTERAVKVAEAMNELTAILRANWDEMYLDQGRGRALQPGGSIMWSPNWGWQILARSPAQQYCADSIYLEPAAKEDAQIGLALDLLWKAMRLSASTSA
jgi:hypothetical protein